MSYNDLAARLSNKTCKAILRRERDAREEFVMTLVYPVQSLAAHPPRLSPAYKSTVKRSPSKPLIPMRHTLSELTGPAYGHETVRENDHDLTVQGKAEPIGERIIVHGHVLDEDGRGVPNTLVELWQANACGRYVHVVDQHPAPLDPNFTGAGRAQSDAQGYYRFVTIKPGAYPWGNHHNAWRPAHIHFSVFGTSFQSRLVTQMYFPNDPLFPFDPIMQSVPDVRARERLVSKFDLELTNPEWALGYRFDIVLRGRDSTPFEGRT
jgi:protocatechuate 3,4-dioxygenase beta subunit